MRKELEHIARIEQYLLGEMSTEATEQMTVAMQEDKALQLEVNRQQTLQERIQCLSFKEEMMRYHHQHIGGGNGAGGASNFGGWFNIIIAMVTISLTVVTIALVYPSNNVVEAPQGSALTALPVSGDHFVLTPPNSVDFPPALQVPLEMRWIDNNGPTTVVMPQSGSVLHIPAGIFEDEEGNAVSGEVELRFREFRDAADMVFAKLPMTYGPDTLMFNSAGMFEVRAFQNGMPLEIREGQQITIDYNLTDPLPNLDFYYLDQEHGAWEQLNEVHGDPMPVIEGDEKEEESWKRPGRLSYNDVEVDGLPEYPGGVNALKNFLLNDMIYPQSAADKKQWGTVMVHFTVNNEGYPINIWSSSTGTALDTAAVYRVAQMPRWKPGKRFDSLTAPRYSVPIRYKLSMAGGRMRGNLYAPDSAARAAMKNMVMPYRAPGVKGWSETAPLDAAQRAFSNNGLTYSRLVKGMAINRVGIYNYDQLYKLKKRVQILASYVDEQGQPIEGVCKLMMVDKNYNASYSFRPHKFECSAIGRNVFFLYTKHRKLYVMDEHDFAALNVTGSGAYTMPMKEVTETLTTQEDLRRFLGLLPNG